MKMIGSLVVAAVLALTATTAHAAGMSPFVGNWYKDCDAGTKCRIYIQPTDKSDRFTFHFTLSRPDSTPSDPDCTWNVPVKLDKKEGTLVALDPYQNYGFYVMLDKEKNLRSSGTMLPVCGGPLALEELFVIDDLDDIRDE